MSDTSPPTEKIFGLDPRGLLARHDVAERLRAWLPPEPEEIAALFPEFELVEIIGRGGMGAVYRARQPALGREVAIKLLPAEAAADAAFAERFRVEAQARRDPFPADAQKKLCVRSRASSAACPLRRA